MPGLTGSIRPLLPRSSRPTPAGSCGRWRCARAVVGRSAPSVPVSMPIRRPRRPDRPALGPRRADRADRTAGSPHDRPRACSTRSPHWPTAPACRRPLLKRSGTRSCSPTSPANVARRSGRPDHVQTRQFAVRQERWFHRDPRVRWVDVEHDPVAEASPAVLDVLALSSVGVSPAARSARTRRPQGLRLLLLRPLRWRACRPLRSSPSPSASSSCRVR